MANDLRDPDNWPDYPFLRVSGSSGQGTVVAPSPGEQARRVLIAPVSVVLARYRAGEPLQDIIDSIADQQYVDTNELAGDWTPDP